MKPKEAPIDWDEAKIKVTNFNSRALNALFSAVTNEEFKKISSTETAKCERPCPRPVFMNVVLGQTHVNGWSHVIASQNGGSTSYIFPFRLRVLQWSRHLFNYLDK